MDANSTQPIIRYNRFLPYWAVFQADFSQTLHSWIYRVWVFLSMGVAIGFLLYRYGAKEVSGIVQPAPEMISDLLKWIVLGSVTLIIVMTSGAISSDRGSMADSVLSRGISRYQYFMGKWTARLVAVLLTFLLMSGTALFGAYFLLHSENLSLTGSAVAIAIVASLLVGVITCGVSVSAISNNSIVSISVVWMTLYGGGFLLSLLPSHIPSPDRAMQLLPNILKGLYDVQVVSRLMMGSLGASLVIAIIGMFLFSRRDV